MDSHETKIVTTPAVAAAPNSRHSSMSASTITVTDADTKAASLDVSAFEVDLSEKLATPSCQSSEVDLEKQQPQDADKDLPQPKPKIYTSVRYTLLNTYRRLFSIIFVANLVAFVLVMIQDRQLLNFVNAAAANLLVCGLARQPLVVNAMYVIACRVPRSAPLRLRMLACKIFHVGGVHSGAGVASCMWYIAFVGIFTHQYTARAIPSTAPVTTALVLAWLIMVLFVAMIVAAFPAIRTKYHDYFEWTHRFAGWSIILLFWGLLLAFSAEQNPSMGHFLVHQPSFWIIIILTLAVVQPWAMLKKVPVRSEVLSSHAIRLHFDHTTVDFGQGLSVARHPFRDWHSFASFPDRFDCEENKFSMLVSKAGDWTSDIIANPPTHIWKRSVPAYGFGYVMRVYNRIIVVTTGSGIGPCLSFLGDDNRPAMRTIWQTREPLKTYGDGVMDLVKRLDPNPVILDTTKGGRVDMLPFVINLYREFDAEAVCVVSNPMLTKKIVYGLECRGIPAFGPIFDS